MTIADAFGRVLQFFNVPGFARECDYWAKGSDVHVTVRKSHLFTTITVNGIDIYFDRATGRIDGTGIAATSGSRGVLRPQSTRFAEQPVLQPVLLKQIRSIRPLKPCAPQSLPIHAANRNSKGFSAN